MESGVVRKGKEMQTKYCPDCGELNISTAKFCMGCRCEFPTLTQASRTPPKKQALPKVEDEPIYDDNELSIEADVELASSFINYFEAAGLFDTPKGIKLQDALKSPPSRGLERRHSNKKPPSARQILQETANRRRTED